MTSLSYRISNDVICVSVRTVGGNRERQREREREEKGRRIELFYDLLIGSRVL